MINFTDQVNLSFLVFNLGQDFSSFGKVNGNGHKITIINNLKTTKCQVQVFQVSSANFFFSIDPQKFPLQNFANFET